MIESQAQHLADWKARQKQAQGKVLYLPLKTQVNQLCWQEKVMNPIGKVVAIFVAISGLSVLIIQLGKHFGR